MDEFKPDEKTLALDWEYIDACNGFSFDMGGSVMKVVYVAEQDWIEPSKREKGSQGLVRLVNFSRDELEDAIKFINEKVKVKTNPSTGAIDIFSTGWGGTQFSEKFKKEINTNHTSLSEYDCFAHGFMHMLKSLPRKDVLYPTNAYFIRAIEHEMERFYQVVKMLKDTGESGIYDEVTEEQLQEAIVFPNPDDSPLDRPLTEYKDLFPCLLMMLGSGFAAIMVKEDGTYYLAEGSIRGGRKFLGLGSLLTGAKNYNELMDLCEKGTLSNVTVSQKAVQEQMKEGTAGDKEDMYAKFTKIDQVDQPLFVFGHTPGKTIDDFKKEDLAAALLHATANDITQVAYSAARQGGAKHVFFAGGFVNHPFVREMFTLEWLRRDGLINAFRPGKVHHAKAHFMVHDQSLGTIGALLNHKDKWYEKLKATRASKTTK